VLGKTFRVTQDRGKPLDCGLAGLVIATIHPSAVLRSTDREDTFAELVADLRVAAPNPR
jgi:DNA polymerase